MVLSQNETAKHTTHFPLKSRSHPYTVIRPLTPLEELEAFFRRSGVDFALGEFGMRRVIEPFMSSEVLASGLFPLRDWEIPLPCSNLFANTPQSPLYQLTGG